MDNPASGNCAFVKQPAGQGCDADGSVCTENGSCANGSCTTGAGVVCDDNSGWDSLFFLGGALGMAGAIAVDAAVLAREAPATHGQESSAGHLRLGPVLDGRGAPVGMGLGGAF
ncbi:MAG: hypothetical protein FJ100_21505 [Deltaproteobacteria bacterium]|nr:hypothetical protein [Deltaproteobacteria bacterium]